MTKSRFSHVLFIPDGHRRIARETDTPLSNTYAQGAAAAWVAAQTMVDLLQPSTLTFYAIAIRNLVTRSPSDLAALWKGLSAALELLEQNPRIGQDHYAFRAIGERDRWPKAIGEQVAALEHRYTDEKVALTIQFLIAYSGDRDFVRALSHLLGRNPPVQPDRVMDELERCSDVPVPIDLVIRTGTNMRLTDGPFLSCRRAEYLLLPEALPHVTVDTLGKQLNQLLSTPPAAVEVGSLNKVSL